MAAHLETAMPDLPLPQMIYLAGAGIAFSLFAVALFFVQFTVSKNR